MEGTYWFRLSVIVMMFLGSIYVLLPTILQEDPQAEFAEKALSLDTPSSKKNNSQEMLLEVVEGDAKVFRGVLEKRFASAGIAIDGLKVEGNVIKVTRGLGTAEGDVMRAARRKGEAQLYLPALVVDNAGLPPAPATPAEGNPDTSQLPSQLVTALGKRDKIDLVYWGDTLPKLARTKVPKKLPALPGALTFAQDGKKLVAEITEPVPPGHHFTFVTIDQRIYGVRLANGNVIELPKAMGKGKKKAGKFERDQLGEAVLLSGALPGSVSRVTEEVPDEAPKQVADAKASTLPPWLRGLLPDTRMNLGLDLQGGIDLTLQVELDEAVQSQASRDRAYFNDAAARDGLNIISSKVSRTEPVILIQTDMPLSDLQEFFRKGGLFDYIYDSTNGNTHGFRMKDERIEDVQKQAVEQVLETLRKRVDATGVKEPSIVKKGGGRINVQLPGKVDLQEAVDAIGTTALLEFRLVDEDFDDSILEKIVEAARDALPANQFSDDKYVNEFLWSTKRLNEDRIVLWQYEETPDGMQRSYPIPLRREVMLTGNDVNNATVGWDQNQQPYVSLDLKPRGGKIFCDVTGENVGKRFGIILDGQVRSAPNIRERICGGRASIEMGSSASALNEANTLALVLRTGSLDAPVSIGEVRTVGSTLGADSIKSGTAATAVGSLIVLVFMGGWYRSAGMVANVALVLNVLLVFSSLALFGATLTLPGIAGIALTIGMAVDANIIIYERIREELRLGIQPRKAVDTGFEKGVVAVLDANITTAIAGIVLFSYGTGPIKGFAVTLLVGIVTTLVTALFVTRTFMDLITRRSDARLRI